MKPWELLGETLTPDGTALKLMRRGEEYVILADGKSLMSSRMHGSEDALATLGCQYSHTLRQPCVLIGGLGMGFTLRATLELLGPGAIVVVAELLPAVVEWNRGALGALAGNPLNDSRVRIEIGDVASSLRASQGRFDAVLLDVDNGPAAFTVPGNASLYNDSGIATLHAALKKDGVVAVWSVQEMREDREFEQRLRRGGFTAEVKRVRGFQKKSGPRHLIFLGRKASAK